MSKKFKTAEQLGLRKDHYCALVKALDSLQKGTIRHVRNPKHLMGDGSTVKVDRFNMSYWRTEAACGTVGCIGGTAEVVGGLKMWSLSECAGAMGDTSGLYNLFYPHELDTPDGDDDWGKITPKHAVKALQNYLTSGKPKWLEVMKK